MTSTDTAAREAQARAIAAALGEGWTAEPVTEGYRSAYITGPDSARLLLLLTDLSRPTRLLIIGEIPTPHARRRYDYVPAMITVSRDKAPEKIARDITGRLMPAYLPKLAESLESERQHAAYVGNVGENAAGLEAIALGILRPQSHRTTETSKVYALNLPDGFGTVTVGGSSVTLELSAISPALAARILETIASA